MFDWDEGDRFSFEDSDRFEEDSLCSWMSEPESVCNNWRGWKKNSNASAPTFMAGHFGANYPRNFKDGKVLPLLELAAREVACHIPFEVVERMDPPVPEQLQLRIAFWSFPENEEDIRLYSCLANGSADEFQRGENLLKARAVKELLQIGFHLSASVVPTQPLAKNPYNVAVTFDRRRITSCNCTCNSPASWCSHVVAVCLFRIHQATHVCLRAPVSESLNRLHREQLQKFAQYLISELPQQILPTAQRLLDELLSSQHTAINTIKGAPDPTAGASINEQTSWCLDESQLHENIKKILIKLCVPSPIVFSDVNYLSSTAPPAAAEWSSLLRPLRGREPEGMWNLLSIVREMFRRGDRNAIPLLEVLTEEVLACEQIVNWWFSTRVSLHAGGHSNRASMHSNTHASQHACSSLCDEIVVLWRLACLNPGLSPEDKNSFFRLMHKWHIATIERVSKNRNNSGNNGVGGGNQGNGLARRTDFDVFPGFKPALEACLLRWDDYPIPGVTYSETCGKRWYCPCVHAQGTSLKISKDGTVEIPPVAGSSTSLIASKANRNRGRSVEIGTCSEWRISTVGAVAPVSGTTTSGHVICTARGTPCPFSVINPSSSDSADGGSDELLPEAEGGKKISSNRSSFSSEGFCETETEQFEADTALAKVLSTSLVINNGKPGNSSSSQDEESKNASSENAHSSDGSAAAGNCDKNLPQEKQSAVEGVNPEQEISVKNAEPPIVEPVAGPSNDLAAAANRKPLPSEQSKDDKNVVIVRKTEDPMEILFARAEALHAHGLTKEACRLAVQLAEEMLTSPPNLTVDVPNPPVRGKRQRRFNPACHHASLLASTTLSKAAFLCSVLTENLEHHHLAFRIGLFGLELARPPASTKALEVKLANQEQDLVVLLKRMPLMFQQLGVLREKAEQLRDGQLRSRGDALLPLMLASYIFDALVLSLNQQTRCGPTVISGRLPTDELLGFEAAVAALGLKANVSEAEHPLLCEGTRRQRGELAITLLVYYKDDQEKLTKIMDRLLDKEVHQMFKNPVLGGYAPSQPKAETAATVSPTKTFPSAPVTPPVLASGGAVAPNGETLSSSNSDESLESRDQVLPEQGAEGGLSRTYPLVQADGRQRAVEADRRPSGDRSEGAGSPCQWDENYKAWEARFRCTNLKTAKKHSVGMASIDSSAPETTSSDNSPTVVRRSLWMRSAGAPAGPGSDSGSSGESSDSFASSSSGDKAAKLGKALQAQCSSSGAVSTAVLPAEGSQTGVVTVTSRLSGVAILEASSSRAAAATLPQPSNLGTSQGGSGSATAQNSPSSANTPPSAPGTPAAASAPSGSVVTQTNQPMKQTRFKGKRPYPSIPNQPSEASAHFMFELAKTVLTKAGGNSSTAVLFTQQTSNQSHRGPHRALHMCAFQIGVYALGLHNAVSPNWLSRTYSSHVSWITGQAMEIGAAAISFLIETWEGHLTPPEVASLADRASRGRDPAMVRAAAKLALSCLPHAHALNPNEIQRALIQCKEQSSDQLEQACLAVESAAKGGGVYPEVLFEVARKWFELYEESLQAPAPAANSRRHNRAPYVQASVGEFQVPSNNAQQVHDNNAQIRQDQAQVFMAHQQNLAQPSVSVANQQVPPMAMQVLPPCGPPPFGMPHATPGYPYAFYQGMAAFPPPPPLALHPAYIPNGGPQPFQYQYYPNASAATSAVVAANMGHLRGMLPPGGIFPGQQMISNVVVTQAAAISQAQNRFQMLAGQANSLALQQMNVHGLHMHPGAPQMHGMHHHHHHHQQPMPMQPQLSQRQLTHLLSAYRVGMLALETLARRVHDDRPQTKYARNPSYGEDVKWLLNCTKKLGASYLQDFCICTVNSVASPFVLYDIVIEAAQYLSQSNSPPVAQPLRSPLITPLLQKCQQMFIACTHFKMYHITPADYDEFVQIVRSARSAFQLTPGGMVQFNELLQSLRRSKSCKKDLWQHLTNSLQQQPAANI